MRNKIIINVGVVFIIVWAMFLDVVFGFEVENYNSNFEIFNNKIKQTFYLEKEKRIEPYYKLDECYVDEDLQSYYCFVKLKNGGFVGDKNYYEEHRVIISKILNRALKDSIFELHFCKKDYTKNLYSCMFYLK